MVGSPAGSTSPMMWAASSKRVSFEAADRAAVGIGGEYARPKARLMETDASLAYGVTPLDVVAGYVDRPLGSIPPWPRSDEVDERNAQRVCRAKSAIVRLVDHSGAVRVAETIDSRLVLVRRSIRGVETECRRSSLHCRTVDPSLIVEERYARPAEGETVVETALVGNVQTVLCAQDVERGETRGTEVGVVHDTIMIWPSDARFVADRRRFLGDVSA